MHRIEKQDIANGHQPTPYNKGFGGGSGRDPPTQYKNRLLSGMQTGPTHFRNSVEIGPERPEPGKEGRHMAGRKVVSTSKMRKLHC